ncbi:hypothetical protein RD792_011409, partial [Penstemon davidsonii]
AIYGTHVRVEVSIIDAPRYRGRKCHPSQNVLAACTFDLMFTYVLHGWEGSTSDSRILSDALTREIDCLSVPQDDANKNLKCNDAMDDSLVDSLKEQNLKGQKIGGTFTKAAYRATSRAVSDKFNIVCDPTHVKNREPAFGQEQDENPNLVNIEQIVKKCNGTLLKAIMESATKSSDDSGIERPGGFGGTFGGFGGRSGEGERVRSGGGGGDGDGRIVRQAQVPAKVANVLAKMKCCK